MGRCKKERCCRSIGDLRIFRPAGIPFQSIDLIRIYADEFEAVRLCDYEGKNQIQAAEAMAVSR